MKLLYSGSTFCDQPVLKRLLLVGEELYFMDRPSVTFRNWGTIGHATFARRIDSSGSPVPLRAIEPPSGPAEYLYSPYIEADINNPSFVKIVLEGFRSSDEFASKFVQFEANYGSGKGKEIVEALRVDNSLQGHGFDLKFDGANMFDVSSPERRRETFKILLIEASIAVTSTLLVAEDKGIIPVSEDPFTARLLSLRSSDSAYIGRTSKIAPYVGLDIAKAVIPEEALRQLSIPDILKYREKAKDAYAAWTAELNRVAANISNIDKNVDQDEIAKLIATDVTPKIIEYKNEMCAIRDDLFSGIIKKVARWEVPSLSLAYLANLGFAGAVALFVSALTPAVPDVVDYFKEKKKIERKHAMAFLIKLTLEK